MDVSTFVQREQSYRDWRLPANSSERKWAGNRGRRRRPPESEARLNEIARLRLEGKSLREIGKIVGISGERVRQLLASQRE